MCLAVPAKIVEITGEMAKVEVGGVQRLVSLMLVPDLQVGDYVITHAGFALHRVDEQEALASINLLRELVESVAAAQAGEVRGDD
ncbi:MAG: HypC/HybG/HupF family hydrogenase formation chaperone [Desulfarculus sp.]|nr:HypC/HybG/HupF family hydrogenase formation chaperone [Desulfarculus sp.]